MKISTLVIQNRNISVNTENDFVATYKGKEIIISTNHGFVKPKYDHLKRYNIDVIDIAIISIGQQLVEIVLTKEESKTLKIGQKVNVSTKAFTPNIQGL